MKNPWVAAVLNFFFMGPGTFYVGRRRALGAALTVAAVVLTWVELQIKVAAPSVYPVMFVTVLVMNTFFAIDGYVEARSVRPSPAT
jgi:hypothetical protein